MSETDPKLDYTGSMADPYSIKNLILRMPPEYDKYTMLEKMDIATRIFQLREKNEPLEIEINLDEMVMKAVAGAQVQWREEEHPRATVGGQFIRKDTSSKVRDLLKLLPKWEKAKRGDERTASLDFVEKYLKPDYEPDITLDNWQSEAIFEEFTDLSQLCVDLDFTYQKTKSPSEKRKITALQIMYTEVQEKMVKKFEKIIEALESGKAVSDLTTEEYIEIIKDILDLGLPTLAELRQRLAKDLRPLQERI